MLIHERSVTKPFSTWTYQYLMRRLYVGNYSRIENTGVVKIVGGPHAITYAILRHGEPVSWLTLARRVGWEAWEVRQVFSDPKYRGRGFAARIYRAAVCDDGIILASGKTQSWSSRALWASFVRKKTFNIWAQDFNNLDLRSDVWVDDYELQSELEIYSRFSTKHDVRLIAVRK